MTNAARYQKRTADIRRRIASSKLGPERCRIIGCGELTTASKGKGLNKRFCRRHVDQYRRHGSYYKTSYSAGELRAYRRKARIWLETTPESDRIKQAIEKIQRLYWRAGSAQEAFRLAGRSPAERAKYAWARLRDRKVDPKDVLAVWLAVEMRIRDDTKPDRHREFKVVQAAKLIHRLAGGSRKTWHHESGNHRYTTELRKHPASRGIVLRKVGQQLEGAARDLGLPK
jgi:hypothetical protein